MLPLTTHRCVARTEVQRSGLCEPHLQPRRALRQPEDNPPLLSQPPPTMEAPVDVVPSVETTMERNDDTATKPALTPPTSEDMGKRDERMSSELSELESDDDEEIEPDHYWDGGKVPVFKPVRCTLKALLRRGASVRCAELSAMRIERVEC